MVPMLISWSMPISKMMFSPAIRRLMPENVVVLRSIVVLVP